MIATRQQMISKRALAPMLMPSGFLQRKCACGNHTGAGPVCEGCSKKKSGLQRKLTIGASNDPLELEADRVADEVLAAPAHSTAGGIPPRIQRYMGQATGDVDTAPASVNRVLSSAGRPLELAIQQDMGQRFGHDFSQVRVHSGSDAEQSARDVNANAYTVGHNVVFGAGQFALGNHGGLRLLAHELAHVVQQGAAKAAATHSLTEAGDLRTPRVSEPGRLQRKPKGGKDSPKVEACPPMERNERAEAAKAQLQLVERIPQQEWLIYGFPIGGTEISGAEAGRFISAIVRSLMQGHFVYMTGQDPLEVLGFSDCFAGPQVDNHAIRQLRAAKFCAGVEDHYAATPKTYTALIRACRSAPIDQYVESNATRADRAQNRSILVRRVAAAKVKFEEGNESFPYDPKYEPSAAHCAAYTTSQARGVLGRVYTNNAHCSCIVTPDEPHNNCVRDCLQDKMWNLLASQSRGRKPDDPPMDINIACPLIWKHHRECYHDCGCASEFIDYLAFDAVCNIALPCAVDSAAINLVNRCMPATKKDKYLPVD
jgi:Domain of unknown function (DUF4157)